MQIRVRPARPAATTLVVMNTIVAAADAAHFLSLVPHLLGFTPARSLVVVPFAGSRSLGAMRADLPPGEHVEATASSLVGMVCRIPQADAMIAVVYTDESVSGGLPGAAVLAAVGRAADACGLHLGDAITVAADGWGSHLDPRTPAEGRPLADITGPRRDADDRMPLPAVTGGDQASGAALPRRRAAERRTVGKALHALEAAIDLVCGVPRIDEDAPPLDAEILSAVGELDDPPALFEDALRGDPASVSPLRTALLVWCLSRPSLRDVALVQWATDLDRGDEALEAQRRWEEGESYPDHLGEVMWGDADRPDPARLEAALEVVRQVAALAPRRSRPGPLALCAWLSWALGRSTHADRYAHDALEIDPDHGLAEIMLSFVQVGHLPDWAFRLPGGDVR